MRRVLETSAIPAALSLEHNQLLLIVFMFITALGIRLYRINEPPLSFHATRQYRSFLIARSYYYEGLSGLPEWKKGVARINQQRQGILEPPIMERLVSVGYRLYGGEQFWIPRILSILFWLVGGGFLYLIATKIANGRAALFSMAFYLFLPFSIVASRSFQPDPFMVMLLLACIYANVRYNEQLSLRRLIVVYALSAFAIFTKPVSLFIVYMVFGLLAFYRQGLKRALTDRTFLAFFLITPLPALLFYLYEILTGGVLQVQAQASFLPSLLLDSFYWRGWLNNIRLVIGFTPLFGALLGVMMFNKGLPRVLMAGLWVGYILFCLVFNYHIATHDYYHLQLVPIVALSLGPLLSVIIERLEDKNREWYGRLAIHLFLLVAFALYVATTYNRQAEPQNITSVNMAEEIGRQVNHSTSTVYLASDYGLSLEYHGELSGYPWPLISDLEWERLAGVAPLDANTRFNRQFAKDLPRYFIVLDFFEFEKQKDLKQFLMENYPLVAQGDSYLIFSLQQE